MPFTNTKEMFADALRGHYAVCAFNFFNLETLRAVLNAADATSAPVILSISESALKYMGDDFISFVKSSIIHHPSSIALHLDHGSSFESCKRAVDLGFTSVMYDGSELSIDENIKVSRMVAEYAHSHDVSAEAELGILAGIEDTVVGEKNIFTNPNDVVRFANDTGIDSLAISIGTSHGAYKRKSEDEELRFDILDKIAELAPHLPLVLHGASSIPEHLVNTINKNGGKIENARGIPLSQLKRAAQKNICKINVDSDGRLAFVAAVRKSLADNPSDFNPRKFLTAATELMTETYINRIKELAISN